MRIKHKYGDFFHLVDDKALSSYLTKLSDKNTHQPLINFYISKIYEQLLRHVLNAEFEFAQKTVETRMIGINKEARTKLLDIVPNQKVAVVNLARAGTLPSHICYTELNYLLDPNCVRQDHISIARQSDKTNKVTGSALFGHKIGGKVKDYTLLIPDPMGATGSSIIEVLNLYSKLGRCKKIIAVHCIVTPEYLRKVHNAYPNLIVYAARLDRGLSSQKILKSIPGTYWSEERGLNDSSYIVPGAGGIGEIMNNAYV